MATSLIRLSVESNQYEQKMRGAKKQFEDFTASIGINMKKLTAFGIATGVAATAINSLTGKISEAITEGGRMAKEYEGVKQAFDRLNQPGLLDNLKQATHGTVTELELMKQAVKFDNFGLDTNQLGSMLAFAQQQAKDTGQSVDYLVDSIVTGLGRKSLPILDNLGLSATEIRNRMGDTGDMTKAVADIIQERMEKAGGYVETASDRAAQANVRLEEEMRKLGETMQGLSGAGSTLWTDLQAGAVSLANTIAQKLIPLFNQLAEWVNGPKSWEDSIQDIGSNIDDNGNYIRRPSNGNWAGWDASKGQYKNSIASIPEITVSGTKPTKTTKSSTKTEMSPQDKALQDMNKMMARATVDAGSLKPEDILGPSDAWEAYTESIGSTLKDFSAETAGWTKDFKPYEELMANMTESQQQLANAQNLGAQAAQNFGAALAGIGDPAAKAAGTVVQAIASIALGFAMASKSADTVASGWGWLAWVAAGAAAMATTIATIHSLTGYAEGGIVRGNTYSGDQIYGGAAMVNAGELVLNRAQQSTLAAQLGSGGDGQPMRPYVSGEQIFLGLNSYLKRSGRGEIMTSKR